MFQKSYSSLSWIVTFLHIVIVFLFNSGTQRFSKGTKCCGCHLWYLWVSAWREWVALSSEGRLLALYPWWELQQLLWLFCILVHYINSLWMFDGCIRRKHSEEVYISEFVKPAPDIWAYRLLPLVGCSDTSLLRIGLNIVFDCERNWKVKSQIGLMVWSCTACSFLCEVIICFVCCNDCQLMCISYDQGFSIRLCHPINAPCVSVSTFPCFVSLIMSLGSFTIFLVF